MPTAPEIKNIVDSFLIDYEEGNVEELVETKSGLEVKVLNKGIGLSPKGGQYLYVHYYAVLLDNGTCIGESFTKGKPLNFTLNKNQVVRGLEEGITHFKKGGKGFVVMPSKMAYGKKGKGDVPKHADLLFYIELIK